MSGSIGYCSENRDIKAFIELHVEQGPVLDVQNTDIGVVSGIVGQRRCSVSVFGKENHAGTTPMNMRDDAAGQDKRKSSHISIRRNEMQMV